MKYLQVFMQLENLQKSWAGMAATRNHGTEEAEVASLTACVWHAQARVLSKVEQG